MVSNFEMFPFLNRRTTLPNVLYILLRYVKNMQIVMKIQEIIYVFKKSIYYWLIISIIRSKR